MGGENEAGRAGHRVERGSSPRGRGKHLSERARAACVGLIPAWAGKTVRVATVTVAAGAHPRVGGENRDPLGRVLYGSGSSPRGRGKPHDYRVPRNRRRLIPAWAGKTRPARNRRAHAWAHPRVGGENVARECGVLFEGGSSPRGRGKPRIAGHRHCGRGLIPAWAGKTWNTGIRIVPSWAHPRVGGENDRHCTVRSPVLGSSPRGRGKPV